MRVKYQCHETRDSVIMKQKMRHIKTSIVLAAERF